MTINLQPTGDKIAIKDDSPDEVTKTGLILPKEAREKPTTGTVLAVGKGLITDSNAHIEMYIEVGDKVLFNDNAGEIMNLNGEDIRVVRQHMILGKLI